VSSSKITRVGEWASDGPHGDARSRGVSANQRGGVSTRGAVADPNGVSCNSPKEREPHGRLDPNSGLCGGGREEGLD
jgi:hypothetical protein